MELSLRASLHEPNVPITSVCFPESGYVSMVAHMEDGEAAEVGLVGLEGLVGLPVLLGTAKATSRRWSSAPAWR